MAVTRQRTLISTLDGQDLDPGRVVKELQNMLHPRAAAEMNNRNGHSGVDRAVEWVRQRWQGLMLGDQDSVRLSLNPYNDKGLGLQSVRIGLVRNDTAVRFIDEIDDPTIGVITDGLFDRPHVLWAVVGFKPDEAEEITSLSGHLLMDGVPDNSRIKFATSDQPRLLSPEARVLVEDPSFVRTIVQKSTVASDDPTNTHNFVNRGVYACRYVRKSAAV